jgi:hypothetical protein
MSRLQVAAPSAAASEAHLEWSGRGQGAQRLNLTLHF